MNNSERLVAYHANVEIFQSLVPKMMKWAEHREVFSVVLERIGAMAFDPGAPRFFPEWYTQRRNEYVASRILCTPALVAEFLQDTQKKLSAKQVRILQRIEEHPAYWVYSNLLLHDSGPLVGLRIEDFCSEEHTVYYEMADTQEKQFVPYLLVLAFDNGKFEQSTGFHHGFNTLHPDDLSFFLRVIDTNQEYLTKGLSWTINNRYLDVLFLDSVSYHGEVAVDEEYIEVIWETYPLKKNFDPNTLEGKWRTNKKGPVVTKIYDGPDKKMKKSIAPQFLFEELYSEDSPKLVSSEEAWIFPQYRFGALFFDLEQHTVAIFANSVIAWHAMLYFLYPYAVDKFSKLEAQYIVSLPTFGAALQAPNAIMPWYSWIPFLPKAAKELIAEMHSLAKTRLVYEEAVEAKEFSLRFELEARCKRLDVDVDIIRDTQEAIEAMFKDENGEDQHQFDVTTVAGDYELHDFTPLLQDDMERLMEPLEGDGLFTIHAKDAYPFFASITGGAFVDIVDVNDIVEHIEDLFYIFMDERELLSLFMMNYLFLLFHHQNRQYTSVRTFGIELLKLLYPYLVEIGDDDTDAFISRFSDFVYSRLRTRALVEVKQKPTAEQRFWGTYEIRPTQFFTTLIEKK